MMKKGDEGRARQILQNVRGTSDVEQELEEIRETCRLEEEASKNGKLYIYIYKSKHMSGWKECQFNSTYRTWAYFQGELLFQSIFFTNR